MLNHPISPLGKAPSSFPSLERIDYVDASTGRFWRRDIGNDAKELLPAQPKFRKPFRGTQLSIFRVKQLLTTRNGAEDRGQETQT